MGPKFCPECGAGVREVSSMVDDDDLELDQADDDELVDDDGPE